MKRVTKNNLLKLVDMMKEYQEKENEKLKITINDFIENISYISDIRKGFYKEIIKTRYEIVKSAYKKLKNA